MERDFFSFCSTSWEGGPLGQPESWAKTLFRFLSQSPSDPLFPDYRRQLAGDLRNHPGRDALLSRVDEFISQVTPADLQVEMKI
jgi:hypothetical protein